MRGRPSSTNSDAQSSETGGGGYRSSSRLSEHILTPSERACSRSAQDAVPVELRTGGGLRAAQNFSPRIIPQGGVMPPQNGSAASAGLSTEPDQLPLDPVALMR